MGILQKLRSLLGADGTQSTTATEPTVTVEREPSAESEHAVKGTESEAGDQAATPDEAVGTQDAPSVDDIDGIGPTYAERLAEAGIESVADLATSDVETVAAAAEASPSRVEDWLEQARDR